MGSENCGSLFPCKDQFSAFNFYTSNMQKYRTNMKELITKFSKGANNIYEIEKQWYENKK